ncbi:MAG: FAD-dependent oxidoreductase [Chloroflexota bacterium]
MRQDLITMTAAQPYDLLVIGGGIYGVCVAWDAAQRGLSVALVEQAEFGRATSANSLKTLHGGLRYLQEANLSRMRLMVRERRAWMQMAPHLVRPLPFLLPTGSKVSRHKLLMGAALAVNDWVSFDRNRGLPAEKRLPNSRLISRTQCLAHIPGLPAAQVTGGALWYDAQLLDSEAMLDAVLQTAVQQGAQVANNTAVVGFQQSGRRLHGVMVEDKQSGRQFPIEARLLVNCAGAWSDGLLALVNGRCPAPTFHLSTAINLVTRQLLPEIAVGLPSRHSGREQIRFIVPWQDCSLIGTWHAAYDAPAPSYRVDEATIAACLADINTIYPPAQLTRADVRQVHTGYLPARPTAEGAVRLVRESVIHDHSRRDQLDGLISVIGVKYTTARHTAEKAVDLALSKLGYPFVPCQTAGTHLIKTERDPLARPAKWAQAHHHK